MTYPQRYLSFLACDPSNYTKQGLLESSMALSREVLKTSGLPLPKEVVITRRKQDSTPTACMSTSPSASP